MKLLQVEKNRNDGCVFTEGHVTSVRVLSDITQKTHETNTFFFTTRSPTLQ